MNSFIAHDKKRLSTFTAELNLQLFKQFKNKITDLLKLLEMKNGNQVYISR